MTFEASSHDRIKMIKLRLEYDQKIFTPTTLIWVPINIGQLLDWNSLTTW